MNDYRDFLLGALLLILAACGGSGGGSDSGGGSGAAAATHAYPTFAAQQPGVMSHLEHALCCAPRLIVLALPMEW